MNQTAKSLFTDWYNAGVKKEANTDELKPKRVAMDKILLEKGKDLWLDVANVYFGFSDDTSEGFQRVAQYFKNVDEYFPLKSVNLLRVLSGCLIAEKIEKNDAWASDMLALSIIVNPDKGDGIIPDILARAQRFYITECEKNRTKKLVVNSTVIKPTIAKLAMPTMVDHTSIPEFVKQLNTYLTSTTKDIAVLTTAVSALITAHNEQVKKTFDALSEETNILWWLFGTYSNTLGKPFSAFTVELLSVLAAIELQMLTTSLPGTGKITSIINKALASLDVAISEKITIEQYVTSTNGYQKEIGEAIVTQPSIISSITPITSALNAYFQYSANEWKNSLASVPGVDLNATLEPVKFAEQLYREMMLLRIYKTSN